LRKLPATSFSLRKILSKKTKPHKKNTTRKCGDVFAAMLFQDVTLRARRLWDVGYELKKYELRKE
jgi:hypothetical protein